MMNPPGAFYNGEEEKNNGNNSSSRYPSPRPQKHDDLFTETKWRDLWAAILYYLTIASVLGIAGWSIYVCTKEKLYTSTASSASHDDGLNAFGMFEGLWTAGMMVLAILLSVLSYFVINSSPKQCIVFAFWANIVLEAAFGIYLLMKDALYGGITSLLMALVLAIMYFLWRRHIPLSAELLRTVTGVAKDYPAMFFCSFLAGAASTGYIAFVVFIGYSVALIGDKGGYVSEGGLYGLELWLLFSAYWTQQVIANVFHTIVSGVMATFYFVSGSGRPMGSPTAASAKRALTYSFGSIAFGSLIVALIQMMRFLVRSATKKNSIGGAIADCLLKILEDLVQYFNYYAYIYVAIYGTPFVESAKATWRLVKDRGLDAVINDNLVGTCVWLFALLNGLVCLALTYIVFTLFRTFDTTLHQYWTTFLVCFVVFLAGVFVTMTMLQVVTSGVSATFVCMADDPAALKRTKPELYARLQTAYSNIFYQWA